MICEIQAHNLERSHGSIISVIDTAFPPSEKSLILQEAIFSGKSLASWSKTCWVSSPAPAPLPHPCSGNLLSTILLLQNPFRPQPPS